jgi:hypothetical protein
MSIPRTVALALLLAGASATDARAQPEGPSPSVDLGVGVSVGRGGGVRHHRGGLAASALFARRVRPVRPGALVAGLGATAQVVGPHGDDCLIVPGGGCAPDYPGIISLAALGGWVSSQGTRAVAVRVMAGPAVFHSGEGATALGGQARLDIATPTVLHVALVAWVQGSLIPRMRGETYRTGVLGIGVRLP